MVERVAAAEVSPFRPDGERPLRWAIVSLLFAATLINYIDRQALSVLAPVINRDLGLNNFDYSTITAWFLVAYACSMWIFGAVFDRLGNRAGFATAISLWSLSAAAHALVGSLNGFRAVRFALGASESGNWPGATRTVAAWFLPRQRALAMGIVNCGAALGSAIALPVVGALQASYGWQAAFLATGGLGFAWLAAWFAIYPATPRARGRMRPRAIPWSLLLRRREVWGIVLARFFGDPIWWLYLFWLPLYLHNVRGFDMKRIVLTGWLPFLAADLGCLAGGWTSGHLIGRGWSVDRARKTAIVIGTLLMPVGTAAAFVASPYQALAFMSVTAFGFQFWVGNVQTLPGDFFPVGAVGSIAGFAGSAAAVGALIFTLSTGWVVDHFSYTPILVTAGVLGPLATTALFLLSGRVRAVDLARPA
jgi:ACS family hexuronate transporter-like MFS transporter